MNTFSSNLGWLIPFNHKFSHSVIPRWLILNTLWIYNEHHPSQQMEFIMSILLKWHSPGNGGKTMTHPWGGITMRHQSRGTRGECSRIEWTCWTPINNLAVPKNGRGRTPIKGLSRTKSLQSCPALPALSWLAQYSRVKFYTHSLCLE